jgi:hypothetical protein
MQHYRQQLERAMAAAQQKELAAQRAAEKQALEQQRQELRTDDVVTAAAVRPSDCLVFL